jgi:hypothetical protein
VLPGSPWEFLAALAVLRLLASPLLAASFLLAGLIAPTARSRWTLLVATAIEGVAAVYTILTWFVSCHFR